MDPDTEEWSDHLHLHASKVNKAPASESFGAGADQYHPRLTFTVPWCKALEDVAYNTQQHRIVYRGRTYNIKDYDDFMEQHIEVNLVGEAYG
jgi:head-tail adaptor